MNTFAFEELKEALEQAKDKAEECFKYLDSSWEENSNSPVNALLFQLIADNINDTLYTVERFVEIRKENR